MILGALEAGGTKMVCALGDVQGNLHERMRVPTRTPEETIPEIVAFFAGKGIHALGIGSFGPLDLNKTSPAFGNITTTPKPGWGDFPLRARLADALGVPVGIDTDVNAAALGEAKLGAGKGLHTIAYFTVGTGIGGGGMVNGGLLHGLMHPEMGHLRIPHDLAADPYPGCCPYHGDCLEGLACGPAIAGRWGAPAETLPGDHPAWALEARYLAYGVVCYILTLSPQRVVVGGGVMAQPRLMPLLRAEVLALLNGYLQAPAILEGIDAYIVPPALGSRAGVVGALALAENALEADHA